MCVPSVPWTCPICPVICPVCPADILPLECEFPHKSAKRRWCPWDVPNLSLGHFRGIPTTKFLYVIFFISGKKEAHKLLTHKLFEQAVNPGTTSRLTRRNCLPFWVRRRTHRPFCPVNWPVVPGSTGPSPEQKVYVYVPFLLLKQFSEQLCKFCERFWFLPGFACVRKLPPIEKNTSYLLKSWTSYDCQNLDYIFTRTSLMEPLFPRVIGKSIQNSKE